LEFPFFRNRLIEVFFFGILMSIIPFTILFNIINTKFTVAAVFISSNIVFLKWTIHCLVKYRLLVSGIKNYYTTNLIVIILYSLIPIVLLILERQYSNLSDLRIYQQCFFFNFNSIKLIFNLFDSNINSLTSTIIYSLFLIVIVSVLPIFIPKRFIMSMDDEDLIENVGDEE